MSRGFRRAPMPPSGWLWFALVMLAVVVAFAVVMEMWR